MTKALIQLEQLEIGYTEALITGIDLEIHPASLTMLSGDNGAGKSTLVKCLAGLHPVMGGTLKRHLDLSEIVYVPQLQALNREVPVRVREFVALGSFDLQQHTADPEDILEEMNLAHLKDKSLWELSGGEIRRCMLARALLAQPRLMVLDEPFAALDRKAVDTIMDRILKEKEESQIAVLVVTHLGNFAAHADQHCHIQDGKLTHDGKAS